MVDAMIVVGAPNSSNSQRLKEVAERAGCPRAALVQRAADIDWTVFGEHRAARRHRRRLGAGSAGRGDPRRLRRALHAQRRNRLRRRGGRCSSRCPARCGRSRRRSRRHGRLYRRLRRGPARVSRRLRHRRTARPTRASPRASRIPTSCCTPARGNFILTLYEKRVAAGDLPFFLGADGASRRARHHLPAAGEEPTRRHARHASPAGRRRSSPFSTACGSAGRAPAIARRSARRWRSCILPARISRCTRPTRCRLASWRPLFEQAATRGDSVQPGLVRRDRAGTRRAGEELAARSAAGRDPRRSVPRQRVLPRRQAVRPDRFLFRLHRHARL